MRPKNIPYFSAAAVTYDKNFCYVCTWQLHAALIAMYLVAAAPCAMCSYLANVITFAMYLAAAALFAMYLAPFFYYCTYLHTTNFAGVLAPNLTM